MNIRVRENSYNIRVEDNVITRYDLNQLAITFADVQDCTIKNNNITNFNEVIKLNNAHNTIISIFFSHFPFVY